MNVSLTPELERFVQAKVATGLFQTASEVVREALRLLHERDELHQKKRAELLRDLDIGLKDLDEGRVKSLDAKAINDIERRGRERVNRTAKAS